MALTDPRQGWGEGGLQAGSTCSNPWARGWGEAQAWVLGWVCAAPILASVTRLLSWAQPSAPCLALIDLPVRGLVWPWHIFPLSLWASSPLPQSWKWLRALAPSLGFQILGLQDRKVSPWNEPHHPPPQHTVFHQWTGVWPCDREPLSLPLLPGRGDGVHRLPPPHPPKTRISWMWPGSGLSSGSLLPCRPRGGVSRRQAGLQVLGLGRGVLSSWCSKQGGGAPLPLPVQRRSLLPVIPVSTLGGGRDR